MPNGEPRPPHPFTIYDLRYLRLPLQPHTSLLYWWSLYLVTRKTKGGSKDGYTGIQSVKLFYRADYMENELSTAPSLIIH